MKLYLSGPMRHHAQLNRPLFNAVARELELLGFDVFNPAEEDIALGDEAPAEFYAARDTEAILDRKAIAVLPGWEESTGAKAEVALTLWCGFPIYDAIALIATGISGRAGARLAPVIEGRAA